jgi:hypothetical protein
MGGVWLALCYDKHDRRHGMLMQTVLYYSLLVARAAADGDGGVRWHDGMTGACGAALARDEQRLWVLS